MKKILKKLSKKLILGLITLIIIGGPILYLVLLNAKKSEAAWHDDSFGYRKEIPK